MTTLSYVAQPFLNSKQSISDKKWIEWLLVQSPWHLYHIFHFSYDMYYYNTRRTARTATNAQDKAVSLVRHLDFEKLWSKMKWFIVLALIVDKNCKIVHSGET